MRRPWQRSGGSRDGVPGAGSSTVDPYRQRYGQAYAQLVECSLAGLEVRRAAQSQLFQLDGASGRIDHEAGAITFTRGDGSTATGAVQIVGSLDPVAGTWLWGWGDPSVRHSLSEHARLTRAWGEEHDVRELTDQSLHGADDDLAWRLTAVTCQLSRAQGVWRWPTDGAVAFVTFTALTLAGPGGPRHGRGRVRGHVDDWTDRLDDLLTVAAPDVERVVREFMGRIHDIEVRYRDERIAASHTPDPAAGQDRAVDRAIADKQPIYESYWRREDEYHRPCSVGTIRWYDVDAMTDWHVYRLDDDAWRVTYREPATGPLTLPRAYDVRHFADGLRIVDHLD